MTNDIMTEIRDIAKKHGYTHEQAKAHVDEVWAKLQGKGPARLAVVMDAWNIVPNLLHMSALAFSQTR